MKLKKVMAIVLTLAMILSVVPTRVFDNTIYADGNNIDVTLYNPNQNAKDFVIKNLFNQDIKDAIAAGRVEISDVQIKFGSNNNIQIGSFTGTKGTGKNYILDFDKGVALSTGNLKNDLSYGESGVISKAIRASNYRNDRLFNVKVNDPASISFTIDMKDSAFSNGETTKNMKLKYAIGSEEYTKYSLGKYNDRFGIVLANEKNYAVVPNTNDEIAIATVNQKVNSEFFRCNTTQNGYESEKLNINLNGLTKTFTANIALKKGKQTVKFLIGDFGDYAYDSVLFIEHGSMEFKPLDAGKLSVEKRGDEIIVKRHSSQPLAIGTDGTDGTISFTLVEENLAGDIVENVYTIANGESQLVLPINKVKSDLPKTIAYDTSKVTIKDAKMGAVIDNTKQAVVLKIAPPELTLTGLNKDAITVTAKTTGRVVLYNKLGSFTKDLGLMTQGQSQVVNSLNMDKYYAMSSNNGIDSISSNVVYLIKAPTISLGQATTEFVMKNNAGSYTLPSVSAQDGDGNNIAVGNINIPQASEVDLTKAGLYTLTWSVTDNTLTSVATLLVKVAPKKPILFKHDYKSSIIFVEGEPGAVVEIKNNAGKLVASIILEDDGHGKGKGKFVNPIDGDYTAVQIINGVESESTDSINITRTYQRPEITLIGNPVIENVFTRDANSYSYEEQGATVSDAEDNLRPESPGSAITVWDGQVNKFLTPKVTIENPMFSKEGKNDVIQVTNPALKEDGAPIDENKHAFKPFVGKYEIKYTVKDTDGLEAIPAIRLVKVKPYKPAVSVENINADSSINIDALSTASVFLYKSDGTPVNIVSGQVIEVADAKDLYKDGKHAKLKMKKGNNLADELHGKLAGIPDGDYKVLQRLYGLNSEFSEVVTVKHDDHIPHIKLNGEPTVFVVKDEEYQEQGATYSLNGKDKGAVNDIDASKVNINKVGTYEVTYTVTNGTETSYIKRAVVVRPPMLEYMIGDYADFNGDGKKTFVENINGNDIQVTGIEDHASVQLVKGSNGNGALYEQKFNQAGSCVFENLVKNKDDAENYGLFQTVDEIQSPKKAPIHITKDNNAPELSLNEIKAVSVTKGEELILKSDGAMATDLEDDDAELSNNIKIYESYAETNGVIKPAGYSASEMNVDTSSVGAKHYYYAVTDTDGNTVIKLRDVEVLPKAPNLTVVGNEKISATGLEPEAVVELFKQDNSGAWQLFATKVANANGDAVDFDTLDTGNYKLKQIVMAFESEDSEVKAFANPAYVNAKIIDQTGSALKDIKVSLKENNVIVSEKSDENGMALLGVESANKLFDITLTDKRGVDYKLSAMSSEDVTNIGTYTTVLGSILKDNEEIDVSNTYVKVWLKKDDNGKYVETHLAKAKYDNGKYILKHLEAGKTYQIEIGYKVDPNNIEKGILALSRFDVEAGAEGSVKIIDVNLKQGVVTDESGKALKGVTLELYPIDRDGEADIAAGKVELKAISGISNPNAYVTDSDGKYAFSVLDAVPYALVAKKTGYPDKVIIVDTVNGNLLAEDIVMEKKVSSNKKSSKKKKHKYNDDFKDSDDKRATDKKAGEQKTIVKIKDAVAQPKEDNGLEIIKDVKTESILENNKKVGDTYVNKTSDNVQDGSYVAYQSENKDRDDKIKEAPKKGKLFMNPASGSMIYIPAKNAVGKDSFVIETKDNNGKTIKVKKNVSINKQTGKLYGKRDALVLEIHSADRKGFVGSDFNFGLKYKNDLNKDIKKATIAVKIPEGFVPANNQHKVKNGHIMIPVGNIRQGDSSSLNIQLRAENPQASISEVQAVLQEDNNEKIYPEAVSSIDVSVNKLNTKYYVKPYIHGYPNGNFGKEDSVTRAEVAAMLTRCLKNDNKLPTNMAKRKFSDVPENEWYAGYVDDAISYGLFSGYEDGTFKPNNKITRGELASVIGNYLKLDISNVGVVEEPYTDVANHWARDNINALNRYGISIGYDDGTFKPRQEISRQETVKMINNMLYRYALPHVETSFNDMDKLDWSYGDIESAYRGYSYEMNSDRKLNLKEMN